MTTDIKLRRSAVSGKIPTTLQLDLGEVAINTFDGTIFIKKNDGAETIVTIKEVTEDNLVVDSSTLANSTAGFLSSVLSDIDSAVALNTAKATNVTTNLGYTAAASSGTITSSDGTNATLPAATISLAGLMTGADKTKLDLINQGLATTNTVTFNAINTTTISQIGAASSLNLWGSTTGTGALLQLFGGSHATTPDESFLRTSRFRLRDSVNASLFDVDTVAATALFDQGQVGLGVVPGGTLATRNAALAIGDSDTGIAQNGDGILELWANNQVRATVTTFGISASSQFQAQGGFIGNYDDTNNNTWGGPIWGMDDGFTGETGGANSLATGAFGLRWNRAGSSVAIPEVAEGLYVYTGGTLRGGIGVAGMYSAGNVIANKVALTNNDGGGNASITFNQADEIPGQDGNAARIDVNTDDTTGARMRFSVWENVTAGVDTGSNPGATLDDLGNFDVDGNVNATDFTGDGSALAGLLPLTGGTMTGNLILNADPTTALQSATKSYVDTIAAAGIHYHTAVRAETIGNQTSTYNNGSSGVGATLTNAGTQVAFVADGISLNAQDRVLVYGQTDGTQNGIYGVTTVGSASTNWVLTRTADTDSYAPSDPDSLGQGDAFFVSEGDTAAGELYVCNTPGTITFGTTNITFIQISSTAVFTAGAGLDLTGTVFSHTDTSSQSSVNNSAATVIQDVTLDTYGHITGLASTTLTPATLGFDQGVSTTDDVIFNDIDLTGNLFLDDSRRLYMGGGNDFSIQHNGTNSVIASTTGSLFLINTTVNANVVIQGNNVTDDGVVSYLLAHGATGELRGYHYGSQKFATKATGFDVTGDITVTGTVDTRNLSADGTKLDAINQGLATDDDVSFATATLTDQLHVDNPTAIGDAADSEILLATFEGVVPNPRKFKVSTRRNELISDGWFNTAIRLESNVGDTDAAQQWIELRSGNGTNDNAIAFGEGDAGFHQEWAVFDNGNFGINVLNPTEKLDIAGNIALTGTIASGDITISSAQPKLIFSETDNSATHRIVASGGKLYIQAQAPGGATDNGNLILSGWGTVDLAQLEIISALTTFAVGGVEKARVDVNGVTVTGDLDVTGDVYVPDDSRIYIGNNNDLRLYHDQANSIILNSTGDLTIQNNADNQDVRIKSDNGAGGFTDYFIANGASGEVLLYHYGIQKFATKSTGVDVSGDLSVFGASADTTITVGTAIGVGQDRASIGKNVTTKDLEIYASGGTLANDTVFYRSTLSESMRLLSAGGVDITGDLGVTGNIGVGDNSRVNIGDGPDLSLRHDGTNSYIASDTGDLFINNAATGGDTILQGDDNSLGLTDYIRLDGATGKVRLYHYGAQKLVTQATGVDVTGDILVSGNAGIGGATPGGTFAARNAALAIGDSDTGIAQNGDGILELWANNQVKATVTTTGIVVTGLIEATGTIQSPAGLISNYRDKDPAAGNGDWAGPIWGMDTGYSGDDGSSTSTKGVAYGLRWNRGTATNVDPNIGEGMYVYRGGVLTGGIGLTGMYSTTNLTVDGDTTLGGDITLDGTLSLGSSVGDAILWQSVDDVVLDLGTANRLRVKTNSGSALLTLDDTNAALYSNLAMYAGAINVQNAGAFYLRHRETNDDLYIGATDGTGALFYPFQIDASTRTLNLGVASDDADGVALTRVNGTLSALEGVEVAGLFHVNNPTTINDADDSEVPLARFEGAVPNERSFNVSTVRNAVAATTKWHNTAIRLESGVDTSGTAQQWIELRSGTGTTDNAIAFGEGDVANNQEWAVFDNGNLGIGVLVPTEKLDIAGNIAVTGTVDTRNLSADGTKLDAINQGLATDDDVSFGSAIIDGRLTLGNFGAEGGELQFQAVNGTNGQTIDVDGGDSLRFRAGAIIPMRISSAGALTMPLGFGVTGNITVTGTVDGVDIAESIPATLGVANQVLTVNAGGTAGEWRDAFAGRVFDTRPEAENATVSADVSMLWVATDSGTYLCYEPTAASPALRTGTSPVRFWRPARALPSYLQHWALETHTTPNAAYAAAAVRYGLGTDTAFQAALTEAFIRADGDLIVDGYIETIDMLTIGIRCAPVLSGGLAGSVLLGGIVANWDRFLGVTGTPGDPNEFVSDRLGIIYAPRNPNASTTGSSPLIKSLHIQTDQRDAGDGGANAGDPTAIKQFPPALTGAGGWGIGEGIRMSSVYDGLLLTAPEFASILVPVNGRQDNPDNVGGWDLSKIQVGALNNDYTIENGFHHVTVGFIDSWVFGLDPVLATLRNRTITATGLKREAMYVGRCDSFKGGTLSIFESGQIILDKGANNSLTDHIADVLLDGHASSLEHRSGRTQITRLYATEVDVPQQPYKILMADGFLNISQGSIVGFAEDLIHATGGHMTYSGVIRGANGNSNNYLVRVGAGATVVLDNCHFILQSSTWTKPPLLEENGGTLIVNENCTAADFATGNPIPLWKLGYFTAPSAASKMGSSPLTVAEMETAIAGNAQYKILIKEDQIYPLDGQNYIGKAGATDLTTLPGLVYASSLNHLYMANDNRIRWANSSGASLGDGSLYQNASDEMVLECGDGGTFIIEGNNGSPELLNIDSSTAAFSSTALTAGNITATSFSTGVGGVTLNNNDGAGNANITFNHNSNTISQAGNAGRITVNTDATSAAAMKFYVGENLTMPAIPGATVAISLSATLDDLGNFDVAGDLTSSGTVDGRNLSADGSKLDAINQGVATTNTPLFSGLNLDANGGNYASAQITGTLGAFIDLRGNTVNDYDARLIYVEGSRLDLITNADEPINLKHENTTRLATTSAGVDITGNLEVSGNIASTINTSELTLFGGTTGNGANIQLNGASAGTPSVAFIDAVRTQVRSLDGGTILLDVDDGNNVVKINTRLRLGPFGTEGGELIFQNTAGSADQFTIDVNAADSMRIRLAGTVVVQISSNGNLQMPNLGEYANDAAAAAAGTPVLLNEMYVNSSTGAVTRRLT